MAKFLTYIKPFIDNYKKQVIDEDFIKININNIFANNNLQKESVLCIGEVQSGKTKNIIECVKYAVNNNYNIIIVLGGVTNLLLEQSKKRLIEDLSYHEVIARVIDAKENLYHNIETCLSKNIPVVVLTLKGSYQLEELLNSINNCNIIDKKILIIDDECDFGSINVSKNNDFQSLLYKKICNLFSRIKYGKLLSFTATPFSNILSDKSWILKPDRIVSLISYTDYCGCEKFNNSDCYLLIDNDKNDFDWKILKKTFIYWLLCTSVMLLDIDKGIYSGSAKSELLINVSYENNKQEEILEILKKIFDEFYSSDYRNIRYWILDYLIKIGFEISPYSVDELINKVKFIYNQVSINKNECFILLNREGDSAEKFSKNKNNFLIIVSGFMASRGVTFKYLICELFLNSSENCTKIDSLLQKCRWFGNRKNTMKYMRILLNQGIKDSLFYAQKYINLFKGGNVYTLKNLKSELLDLDYESKKINERLYQQKMEKENNKVILVGDEDSTKKGIGIITNSTKTLESIKKIKKTYIKYVGRASILDDDNKHLDVEFIEFNSMPIDILKSIISEISIKLQKENIGIEETLEFIFDLFSSHRLKRDYEKKLIGDLGEVIFMIEAKKMGINADQMIRLEDDSLYDFVFGETYVEVKTSSKYQNEIKITERQISESNDKVIVVSNFQRLEDKLNIIDLYKMLNSNNQLVLEKMNAYENDFKDETFAEVMRKYTVDLDNVEVFVLENSVLPKIEIKHRGGLKDISYTIDITKTNRIKIDSLKKYL